MPRLVKGLQVSGPQIVKEIIFSGKPRLELKQRGGYAESVRQHGFSSDCERLQDRCRTTQTRTAVTRWELEQNADETTHSQSTLESER